MPVVSGGDITEISWSNPSLGAGFFYPIAGEDSELDLGGFKNDDNGVVDGAGRLINSKNRKAWMFSVPVANDPVNTQEFEAATAIAASLEETTWTFSMISGAVYTGVGTIQGEIKLNGNKATFQLKVVGGNQLKQQ